MSVYFVRNEITGHIKIGYSKDPKTRIQSLQTSTPAKLETLRVMPGTENLEQQFHDRFAEYRVRGEWFSPGPELTAFLGIAPLPPEEVSCQDGFKGLWVHTLGPEGYLRYQGQIVRETSRGVVVQLFSWIDGSPTICRLVDYSLLDGALLYQSNEEMNWSFEHGPARQHQKPAACPMA